MLPDPLDDIASFLGDLGFYVGEGIIIAFIASYAWFFNWRKTPGGRAVLYAFSALGSIVLLVVLALIFGREYWGRELVRLVISWSVAIAMGRLLWVLWSNWGRGEPPLDFKPHVHHHRPPTGPVETTTSKED